MFPKVCTKTGVFHAKIVPCDETSYYVADECTSFDDLDDALTPEEYKSFKDLLLNIVTKKNMSINGNHTIDIIHRVDHHI